MTIHNNSIHRQPVIYVGPSKTTINISDNIEISFDDGTVIDGETLKICLKRLYKIAKNEHPEMFI